MDLWILLTITATLIQNARAVGQRWVMGRVGAAGAAYGRFVYGFPLTIVFLIAVCAHDGSAPPAPNLAFLAFATCGALTQSIGNAMFVKLVRSSNFTVITTYSKLETVFSPLFSFVLLDDRLSLAGIGGIMVALAGVVVLAAARESGGVRAFFSACLRPPASHGIVVGVIREWRHLYWIGITGVSASACWLCAFAQQKTGYVLAVGQIELVFAYVASRVLFKERAHRNEIAGILVTVVGILLVVTAR